MSEAGLFGKLVERSGLSGVFATAALRRVCDRAGITPDALAPRDIERLLPDLERTLGIYLTATEAAQRLRDIRALGR